jgi:transcriptional regulator with XRE-family HTH domain
MLHPMQTQLISNDTTAGGRAAALPKQSQPTVGELIRTWRTQRRLSQLELADEANISTRHLSFVETGRAAPSRELLLRLFERLHVPLRARNTVLMAGGYAPMYSEFTLEHPSLRSARAVIEQVVKSHEPYPALVVDRNWNLIFANATTHLLLNLASPELTAPPCNVLRVALHPRGLAPYIRNLPLWREHLLQRMRRQVEASGDTGIFTLLRELEQYPCANGSTEPPVHQTGQEVALPVEFSTPLGDLSFISTITVFGTPTEVTLSEVALECLYPANEATRLAMQNLKTT